MADKSEFPKPAKKVAVAEPQPEKSASKKAAKKTVKQKKKVAPPIEQPAAEALQTQQRIKITATLPSETKSTAKETVASEGVYPTTVIMDDSLPEQKQPDQAKIKETVPVAVQETSPAPVQPKPKRIGGTHSLIIDFKAGAQQKENNLSPQEAEELFLTYKADEGVQQIHWKDDGATRKIHVAPRSGAVAPVVIQENAQGETVQLSPEFGKYCRNVEKALRQLHATRRQPLKKFTDFIKQKGGIGCDVKEISNDGKIQTVEITMKNEAGETYKLPQFRIFLGESKSHISLVK